MSGYIPCCEWINMLDIRKGDTLLVSSDIQRLLFSAVKHADSFSPSILIDMLQKKLSASGTLLFPTFNWDFCNGIPFSYYNTPCMTGTLGREALRREDFKRSLHPIYSFAVWGRGQKHICGMENKSAFGGDSPFAYLHHCGKNLIIDIAMRRCFTFAHYVEERMGVPYRYMKTFTAEYFGSSGESQIRSYSMFVRNLDKAVETLIDPLGDDMARDGFLERKKINGIVFSTLSFSDFSVFAERDILENKAGKLCRYDGQNA